MSESSLDDDVLIAATIAAEEEYSARFCGQDAPQPPATDENPADSQAFRTQSETSVQNERHEKSPSTSRAAKSTQPATTAADSEEGIGDIQPIEEAYGAQNRMHRFRPHGVFVTDFTSSEWCQVQTAFKLHQPDRATKSSPMKRGSKRHEELESEIHVKIPVAVTSREDEWGLRLFNSIFCLLELIDKGLTRELPLFGKTGDIWFRGIVDELRLCQETNMVEVTELKTRGSKNPPSHAQIRTAKLQVMLYHRLLSSLAESCRSPLREEFIELLELDGNRKLADVVTSNMSACGFHNVETLEELFKVLADVCDAVPGFGPTCRIVYESQDDKTVVAEEAIPFDPDWLDERLADHVHFWCGLSQPCGVPEGEAWKCRFCDFKHVCNKKPEL